MLCTDVAEAVVAILKDKKPGTTIKAETDIPVKNVLDPEALYGTETDQSQNQIIGVFAFNTAFKIEGRGNNKRLTAKEYTIVVSICKMFPPQKACEWDTAKWEVVKPYQDLQQLINECLVANPVTGVTIKDVNPEPAQDLLLSQRIFLAGTEITYVWTCS